MKKKRTLYFGEFTQYETKFLTADDSVDCVNISSAVFAGEKLYMTQPDCILTYSDNRLGKIPVAASKLFAVDGKIYAAIANSLYELGEDSRTLIQTFNSPVIDISKASDGSFWVLTEKMLYLKNENRFEEICDTPEDVVCLAAVDNKAKYNETVYVGTSSAGIMSLKGKRRHWSELLPDVTGAVNIKINAAKIDAMGYIWIAGENGINVFDHKNYWFNSDNTRQIPSGNFNDMFFAANGKKYFATTTGIIILSEGKISYYSYGIWLKNPNVKKITVSEKGAVAAVTNDGVSILTPKTMTLADMAAHFDSMAEKYFVRKDGYSVNRSLKKAGDPESGELYNSDNDGLFTGLYCASQCFRYKVTGDETAIINARRAVNAMIKLTEITGKKGFTARAIRYRDEDNFNTGVRSEWHLSESDPDCEWLGETSSDEMTGHYYAYGIYYDLCADEEEKVKIADVVKNITDHIIDNNFRLCDVDGIPTTWANWNPDLLNNDDRWFYERGTNSLEILSFLKTAYHVTGDEKYNKFFDMFIKEYHYGMNTMQYKAEDAHIAHIDDQLDFANIYPLIVYTDNEAQKEIFKMGLTHHWEYEKVERSPWYNITYGALTDNNCEIELAAEALSEMPLDLIRWPVYNSYRPDLIWDDEQEKIGLPKQLKYPVEQHSRYIVHYDTTPLFCDSGCESFLGSDDKHINRMAFLPGPGHADGKSMTMPYVFLLPYWLGRYYGLFGD